MLSCINKYNKIPHGVGGEGGRRVKPLKAIYTVMCKSNAN